MRKVLFVIGVISLSLTSPAFALDCDEVRKKGEANARLSLAAIENSLRWKEKNEPGKSAQSWLSYETTLSYANQWASIYNAFCKD